MPGGLFLRARSSVSVSPMPTTSPQPSQDQQDDQVHQPSTTRSRVGHASREASDTAGQTAARGHTHERGEHNHRWEEIPPATAGQRDGQSPQTSDCRSDADPRSPLVGLDRLREISTHGCDRLRVPTAVGGTITPLSAAATIIALVPSACGGGSNSPSLSSRAPPSNGKSSPALPLFVPLPLPKMFPPTRGAVYAPPAPPPPAAYDSPEDGRTRTLASSTPNRIRSLTRPGHELARGVGGPSHIGAALRGREHPASGEVSFDCLLDGAPLPTDFLSSGADQFAARSAMQSLHGAEARESERTTKYLQAQQAHERAQLLAAHQQKSALLAKLLQVDGGAQVLIRTLTQGGQFLLHSSPLSTVSHTRTLAPPGVGSATGGASSRTGSPAPSPALQARASSRAIAAGQADPSPHGSPSTGEVASSPSSLLAAQPRAIWVSPDLRYIFCSTGESGVGVGSGGSASSGSGLAGVMQTDQILVLFPGHQTRVFRERMAAARKVSLPVSNSLTSIHEAMGGGLVAAAATVASGRRTGADESVSTSAASLGGGGGGIIPHLPAQAPVCLPAHCFSLITPSRTLDLECASEAERDQWLVAFQFLLDHARAMAAAGATESSSLGATAAVHLPGTIPFVLPSDATLSQALELVSTMPPSQANSSTSTPDPGSRVLLDDQSASRLVTISPDQVGARFLRASSSGGASSAASSLGGTPAFGSPMVSPALFTRSLLHLSQAQHGHPAAGVTPESGASSVTSTTSSASSDSSQASLYVPRPLEPSRRSYPNLTSSTMQQVLEALPEKEMEADGHPASAMEKENDQREKQSLPTYPMPSDQQQVNSKLPVVPATSEPLIVCAVAPRPFSPTLLARTPNDEDTMPPLELTPRIGAKKSLSPAENRNRFMRTTKATGYPPPTTTAATMPAPAAMVTDRQEGKPVPTPSMASEIPPPAADAAPAPHELQLDVFPSPPTLAAFPAVPSAVLPSAPSSFSVSKKDKSKSHASTLSSDLHRLRVLINRERADNAHLRVWVAHRFLHLQSHINSLMIEQRKLQAQKAAQAKQEEEQVEREIQRIMGASTHRRTPETDCHRRCSSVH